MSVCEDDVRKAGVAVRNLVGCKGLATGSDVCHDFIHIHGEERSQIFLRHVLSGCLMVFDPKTEQYQDRLESTRS